MLTQFRQQGSEGLEEYANASLDYASHDGTAIRDYIHILDLADGHLKALNYLRANNPGVRAWNLGTGKGSTVYEMIRAFSAAIGRDLPYEVAPRRAGDVLNLTSNPTRANKELGWKAQRTLEQACETSGAGPRTTPRATVNSPPLSCWNSSRSK